MRSADDRELRSASLRLAAQFALVIVALFVALGVVVYSVVSAGQDEAARNALSDASMVDSVHDAPRNLLVTVLSPMGPDSSPNLPTGLPDEQALQAVLHNGQSRTETITAGGQRYLTETSGRRGRVVQISYSLAEQEEELGRLVIALAVSGIIAAVAAAAIGLVLARRSMRPMAEALALQRRFVADAGHELRTPLTLLSTRAQLLRRQLQRGDGTSENVVRAELDEIVDDSRALTEIVEDLLIAADPRQSTQSETVDVGELVVSAARSAAGRAHERGLRIESRAAPGAVITGAPVSLRRMVVALVDNALDHASSLIRLEASVARDEVILSVSDDGAGFSDGVEQHAFERFATSREAQAGASATRHYGLGLALVAEVAARHGARVAASNASSLGGARVTVRFRRSAASGPLLDADLRRRFPPATDAAETPQEPGAVDGSVGASG